MRVVLFRENRFWLAQALEHDIGVQSENLKDVVVQMAIALDMEAPILPDLPPAPKYFQDLWPLLAGRFSPQTPLAGAAISIEWGLVA